MIDKQSGLEVFVKNDPTQKLGFDFGKGLFASADRVCKQELGIVDVEGFNHTFKRSGLQARTWNCG